MTMMLIYIAMITWAGYGVRVERQNEAQGVLEQYISVPEKSYRLNAHQEEMSGLNLAKRYETVLAEMGVKLTVKPRIRTGEYWTEEAAKNAEEDMRRQIYGD